MKCLGIVLCFLASTFMGMYYAERIYERYRMLRDIEDMVMILKNEVEYTKEGISEALYYTSMKTKGKLKEMLCELSVRTKENKGILEDIWTGCVDEYLNDSCLLEKDLDELALLGKNMGYLGMDMQRTNFNKYLNYIENEISLTKENMDKTAKMYRLMGIMGGIGIAIILI